MKYILSFFALTIIHISFSQKEPLEVEEEMYIAVPELTKEEINALNSNEDPVISYPDKTAEYIHGMEAFDAYIEKTIDYPKVSLELEDEGTVYVEFIVEKDSSLTNIKVIRGLTKPLEQEAIRLISQSSKWIPGEARGEAVRTRVRYPVKFKLPE